MTRCSPGTGCQGRYTRRSRRQAGLRLGDGPAEVAGRAGVPRGPAAGSRRLALIRPSVARTARPISAVNGSVFLGRGGRLRRRPAAALDDPPDGLVGRAAQRRGSPIAAQLVVRGQDVQLCPSLSSQWASLGSAVDGFEHRHRGSPGGFPGGSGQSRGGDFLRGHQRGLCHGHGLNSVECHPPLRLTAWLQRSVPAPFGVAFTGCADRQTRRAG